MKYLKQISLFCIFVLLIKCSPRLVQKQEPKSSGFSQQTIEVADSTADYYLYIPEGYKNPSNMPNVASTKESAVAQNTQTVPLMLFLHGAGERGDSLERVKAWGPPKIAEEQENFPFLMLAPQCPKDIWWTDSTQIRILKKILNNTIENYKVDTSRVYLTGMSMGGFGTWKLASEMPNKFTAIAPVCGGGDPAWASKLKNTPIWTFHGQRDSTVPVKRTKEMMEAIRQESPQEIHMTLYPEVGHFSWIKAYNKSNLFQWLLSQPK